MWCGLSSGRRRRNRGSSGRDERSCLMVVERVADAAVELLAEVLAEDEEAEVVAVDNDDAVNKLEVDENAKIEAEEAVTGCTYAKSNSSSLRGSGNTISVL
jgi:hypothetical protein